MPRTRFAGSKRRLCGWIWRQLRGIEFDTALDAFGGTGSVSYELKRHGKAVTYNDVLRFNYVIGTALIENASQRVSMGEVERLIRPSPDTAYDDFVEQTFSGIYFTDDENRWIDRTWHNIRQMTDVYRRAVACYALFQSALAKRPYNLFHRRNLYMRTANVSRSFGNKTSWDRPFEDHFRRFAAEANAAVFDSGRPCRAVNCCALQVSGSFDLVYIDPPYVHPTRGGVNYRQFYHFLEGLTDYANWSRQIDWSSKHLRLQPRLDRWCLPSRITGAFAELFARFADSILVVSYRSDGVPTIEELAGLLRRYKGKVRVSAYGDYQYALSTNKRSKEMLLIGS